MPSFRISLLGFLLIATTAGMPARSDEPIRVGWQTTWAVQAQLVMGLMKTPIGDFGNLDLAFNDFPYGGPLNQAAIGGAVDVVLTADQPALVLLDRSDDFKIVGRMMYNRVCLYVPAQSAIDGISQLAGKRVSGPVGAAAERFALDRIAGENVDLDEITFGSLNMAQQAALLGRAAPAATSWTGVDALYGFDPLPAVFEQNGMSRNLDCGRVVSVVLMRVSSILSQPDKARDFMCAFTTAWYQYASDPALMNALFLQNSGLDMSHAVLDEAASMEPNFAAPTFEDMRFSFDRKDFEIFDDANRFLVGRKILNAPVVLSEHLDFAPLKAALGDPSCTALRTEVPFAPSK